MRVELESKDGPFAANGFDTLLKGASLIGVYAAGTGRLLAWLTSEDGVGPYRVEAPNGSLLTEETFKTYQAARKFCERHFG